MTENPAVNLVLGIIGTITGVLALFVPFGHIGKRDLN
jgi:hypothetical protein